MTKVKDPTLTEGNQHTKEDLAVRAKVKAMFGAEVIKDLKPSNRLNKNQKDIFLFIKKHIENVGIHGDIDAHMLETASIAIDRLQNIEKLINTDFDMIRDRELMQAKSKYTTDFIKAVEFFGMAPTARAKIGLMVANNKAQETDPLLKVLKSKKNKSG
jgi:Phage terminase, small subunit